MDEGILPNKVMKWWKQKRDTPKLTWIDGIQIMMVQNGRKKKIVKTEIIGD